MRDPTNAHPDDEKIEPGAGLEPAALALQERRSGHLSYPGKDST